MVNYWPGRVCCDWQGHRECLLDYYWTNVESFVQAEGASQPDYLAHGKLREHLFLQLRNVMLGAHPTTLQFLTDQWDSPKRAIMLEWQKEYMFHLHLIWLCSSPGPGEFPQSQSSAWSRELHLARLHPSQEDSGRCAWILHETLGCPRRFLLFASSSSWRHANGLHV